RPPRHRRARAGRQRVSGQRRGQADAGAGGFITSPAWNKVREHSNVQRAACRCTGGVGRTHTGILGMFSGTTLSAPSSARRKIVTHVAPAPVRRHDPTISPYASCCSAARTLPVRLAFGTWTWAVTSFAAGERGEAGERRGKRNPDNIARRRLLAVHCRSGVS